MELASEAEVVARLRHQGHIPMRAEPAARVSALAALLHRELGRRGLTRQEVANFTRELAIMLGAGQDLDRALRFVGETAPSARSRRVVETLRAQVRDGSSLADAMGRDPHSFSRLFVGMVRAGEA